MMTKAMHVSKRRTAKQQDIYKHDVTLQLKLINVRDVSKFKNFLSLLYICKLSCREVKEISYLVAYICGNTHGARLPASGGSKKLD